MATSPSELPVSESGDNRSLLHRAHDSSSYRVRLAGQGIEWVARDGPAERVFLDEPGAGLGLRLKSSLLSLFVAEELL